MVTLPDKVGILCTNCNMRHRLTVNKFQTHLADGPLTETGAAPHLKNCAEAHPEDLRVSGVNVEKDSVQLRCRECQRNYHIQVSMFETYQP